MSVIAPLDYERYAVLLNPILTPGAESVRAPKANIGVSPVGEAASTTVREHGKRSDERTAERISLNQRQTSRFNLKRVPFSHPDPSTGRGQKIDIFG